jgi:beta-lactamase superfamily II metal-dependent hydrolase
VKSSILMAGHHGSITFFDDPADSESYYVDHMLAIKPEMTVVSVGNNAHGHPDEKALELYEKYTKGSKQGNKVFTTQVKGTLKLTLKDNGWSLKVA